MRNPTGLVLFLVCSQAAAVAQLAQEDTITLDHAPIAFVNMNVLPMDTPAVLEGHTVIVEDCRIARVGPSNVVQVPDGMRISEAIAQKAPEKTLSIPTKRFAGVVHEREVSENSNGLPRSELRRLPTHVSGWVGSVRRPKGIRRPHRRVSAGTGVLLSLVHAPEKVLL